MRAIAYVLTLAVTAPLLAAQIAAAQPASIQTITAQSPAAGWSSYANARFGTRFDYPSANFVDFNDSDNGDGRSWIGRDGVILSVFGKWRAGLEPAQRTPAGMERWLRRIAPERYGRVSYRQASATALVLSGRTAQGWIFYERHLFGDPSGAVHSFAIEYPAALQSRYAPIVTRMARSLRGSSPAR